MAVYVVITIQPEAHIQTALASRYPGKFHQFADTAWVVSTTETAATLAINIGSKVRSAEGTVTGVVDNIFVSELTPNYWGFANQSLWNWLKEAYEGRA